jgi:hypothetical protein
MNDVSKFAKWNVADTCSLWNLFASRLLYSTTRSAGVQLCCTEFVIYECLHKAGPRRPERAELQNRLRRALHEQHVTSYKIDIEDLQELDVLRSRKKLSLGELSVLVFARKTTQAVLTDDRGAQNVAKTILAKANVQNTPHLYAWLYFNSLLGDSDLQQIRADLRGFNRSLDPHLDRYHTEAQRCKAMAKGAAQKPDGRNV